MGADCKVPVCEDYRPDVFNDVLVNHEALMFRRGRIYSESFVTGSRHSHHYDRLSRYSWFLLKNYWLRRGAVRVPAGLWVIDNYSPDNYYHWMIDVLTRLVDAERRFPLEREVLLPRYYRRQPYIHFTLPAFPQIARVEWIGPRTKSRVTRLAFVPRQSAEQMPERVAEVARRVGALAGEPGTVRRIYFSRDDAPRRRTHNEADVVRVLRAHDFHIVRIEQDKPWEQVRASLGADLIVGVHGAALTNLIFMRQGGRVLEFRHAHHDVFFEVYGPLADCMGFRYNTQLCDLAHPAEGLEINNADIVVDLDLLRQNLGALT